jgi:hypothetical protein
VKKLATTSPTRSGMSTAPEDVADAPMTAVTKSGAYAMTPNMVIAASAIASRQAATVPVRMRGNGRMGSSARVSTAISASTRNPNPAKTPSTSGDNHRNCCPPHSRPSSRHVVAPARRAAPA